SRPIHARLKIGCLLEDSCKNRRFSYGKDRKQGYSVSMNKLDTAKRVAIVAALVEGSSVRSTCRMTGACKPAVLKLLADLGGACARYHDQHVRGLEPQQLQCDEIWAFIMAKDRNVRPELKGRPGIGSVWTWTCVDPISKLVVAYHVGTRNTDCA